MFADLWDSLCHETLVHMQKLSGLPCRGRLS